MLLITTTTMLREPPRALSTDCNDPRWHAHASEIGRRLIVELDGQPVPMADLCTYDIDAGMVVMCRRDGNGIALLSENGDRFAMKPAFGEVSARWNSNAIEQLVRVNDPETPAGCRTDIAAIIQE